MESKVKETNIEEKIAYLQIIEGAIDRMGGNSAILKGFAAAVLTGVSAFASFTDVTVFVLVLALLPVLLFGYLDAKYLQVEKKYRVLYEQVRLNQKGIDYSMDTRFSKDVLKAENATLWNATRSWSVWPFYGLLILIGVALVALKCNGCI